jgi:hypothetical protein
MEQLGTRYETGVVSWVGPDGFPLSARVPVRLDRDARRIHLGTLPPGLPAIEGRACLAAHEHAPDFSWQENFQVRGDLVRDGDGWALVPHRLVGGFELPKEGPIARSRSRRFIDRTMRHARTARRRLKQRG